MNQTRGNNRIVMIASSARDNRQSGHRKPAGEWPKAARIVLIKDGKLVGQGSRR